MSRRVFRVFSAMQSINVGLIAGIAAIGCGESRPNDPMLVTEVPNGVVGTLRARMATFDDHAETFYRLVRDDGEEISLDFGKQAPRAHAGERIAVRGPRVDNRIEVDGLDVIRPSASSESREALRGPAKHTFKIAAISLDTAVTADIFRTRVFKDADSPAGFYRDNSYGDWTLEGDVFGPYTIPIANCQESNLWTIAEDAKKAAMADGLDPTKYDNFMYYVPASAGCTWGGIAEVGVNEVRGFANAVNSWYRGTGCVVLAQELGHNFGLLHSHKCTAAPYGTNTYGGASCTGFSEYGDAYTPMGGGCGHFNAVESAAEGFISGCNTLDVTSSGTFEIGPIEAKCTGPQVIRVSANATANYGPQYIYLEYRRGARSVGSDSKSPAGVYFHASAEYGGNHTDIVFDAGHDYDYAVDPFYIHDPLAMPNATWTEPSSGAMFTLTNIGDTATVQVTLAGGGGTGSAKCIDGSTPPSAPMCAMITIPDGGRPDSGGAGGRGDAAPEGGPGTPDVTPPEAGGASGGTAGSGGTGGSTGGTGGATAGTGGATPGTGGTGDSKSGCNCSVPGGSAPANAPAVLLGLAALLPAIRRRRSRRPS